MEFRKKYSCINQKFGDIGWAIGQLSDSAVYDNSFISIADRIEQLNAGTKVDARHLEKDILDLVERLKREGCLFPDYTSLGMEESPRATGKNPGFWKYLYSDGAFSLSCITFTVLIGLLVGGLFALLAGVAVAGIIFLILALITLVFLAIGMQIEYEAYKDTKTRPRKTKKPKKEKEVGFFHYIIKINDSDYITCLSIFLFFFLGFTLLGIITYTPGEHRGACLLSGILGLFFWCLALIIVIVEYISYRGYLKYNTKTRPQKAKKPKIMLSFMGE